MTRTSNRGHAKPRQGDGRDILRRDISLAGGVCSGFGHRMLKMAPRNQLDGHVGDDIPFRAPIGENARGVGPAIGGAKPAGHFEDIGFPGESLLRSHRGVYAQHRGQSRVVFTGHARIRRLDEPTDRCRVQGDCMGHLIHVELQQ